MLSSAREPERAPHAGAFEELLVDELTCLPLAVLANVVVVDRGTVSPVHGAPVRADTGLAARAHPAVVVSCSRVSPRRWREAGWLVALLATASALVALPASCGGDGATLDPSSVEADAGPDAESEQEGGALPDASPFVEPDPNEPNDTTPTVVVLTPGQDGTASGDSGGFIATPGDVDRFAVEVPSGGEVLYVRVTAPSLAPAAATGLRYELRGPGGAVLAQGEQTDRAAPVDLGTAQRITTPGRHEIIVRGTTAAGEPRRRYEVVVQTLPVADAFEPNDSHAAAAAHQLVAPGGAAKSLTGRVGWVGDQDWFRVLLPASARPSVLSYRLVPTGPGRFPRLPGPADLRLRVVSSVTKGSDAGARKAACKTDETACPKGHGGAPAWITKIDGLCDATDPPLCLHAERAEHGAHAKLSNFAGALPIPPHASPYQLAFVIESAGGSGADDVPYSLEVAWSDDPDEAGRTSGGVEQPTSLSFAGDPDGATYPAPPAAATVLSGALTYGFGLSTSLPPTSAEAARGPDDYDAIPSDVDTYVLALPSALSEPLDRTWALQWSVTTTNDTVPAHDLAIDAELCDGDVLAGGVCTPVTTRPNGQPIRLAHPGIAVPWPNRDAGATIAHFDRASSPSGSLDAGTYALTTTSTAVPEGCLCLEPRFVRGGFVVLRVRATDRRHYGPATYTVRTAYTSYPKAPGCPSPVANGSGFLPGCALLK